MKWNSIRTKFLIVVVCCLVVGAGSALLLMRYSFEQNAQVLATETVASAQTLFATSEANGISKMSTASEAITANVQIQDALASKDRGKLLALTAPLFEQFKNEGITNWTFHTAEPDMSVFLRLHNPAKFGDKLNRSIDKEVVRTHLMIVGAELGKAGYVLRTIAPVLDSHDAVVGYVELGEEISLFVHQMKNQTGNDYGLLLNKKFVDRQFWAESAAKLQRRDNWDDDPHAVVVDRTTDSNDITKYDGDLASLPAEGKPLERIQQGKTVFVRGTFPVQNMAGDNVGAIFVVRDISSAYLAMKHTQSILVVIIVVALAIGTVLVMVMLNHLVFRRLKQLASAGVRVVGGDYEFAIKAGTDDEVGQVERLFEKLRLAYAESLSNVGELVGKR